MPQVKSQKFLNAQIERDIDGQKADLANKHNLLGALQQQFNNHQDSQNMLRAIYLGKNASDIQAAALKQGGPLAQARAMQATGPMIQQKNDLLRNIGINQSILTNLQKNPGAPSNPALTAMAIERSTLVPEHQKAEALKQLDETQKQAQAIDQITKVMGQMKDLQTVKSRVGSPLQSKSQLQALQLQAGEIAKTAFGRVNERELKLALDNAVNFSDNKTTVDKKIQNLQSFLGSKMSAPALTGNGLPIPKYKPYVPKTGAY